LGANLLKTAYGECYGVTKLRQITALTKVIADQFLYML